jgi:hypothetical protein
MGGADEFWSSSKKVERGGGMAKPSSIQPLIKKIYLGIQNSSQCGRCISNFKYYFCSENKNPWELGFKWYQVGLESGLVGHKSEPSK